ncbi:MAG: HAMP domain-containing histidine kinase [Solirubrobacterales bacterium]|nr:HAMP domain-containing histidine kinase [Solirubrobacterales bacterium]
MSAPRLPGLRRLWPRRVRARLALVYALLFLIAGSALLALTYGLLASRLPKPPPAAKVVAARNPQLLALCKEGKSGGPALLERCSKAFAAGARAGSTSQRDRTLTGLLDASLIGLGVATVASAALGWLVSGRVLKPVRSITDSARRASELELGERLALTGPDDELKELADTFDLMLERLEAAFASQKRFVANAAHELRTPLTAMRTAIEVTLSRPNRTPAQLEAMAIRVKRSIERCQATIEALLTMATSELGPQVAEPVDLATATEDALDSASTAIAERGLSVEAALAPAQTRGDRVLLERMIANLVDNAVQHNQPSGWIRIRTHENGDRVIFEIANTGPAITEDQLPLLFEPFGRAQQRLPGDGVGLGLSIANAVAIAHRASVTARVRPEGGLVLSVVIPRDAA